MQLQWCPQLASKASVATQVRWRDITSILTAHRQKVISAYHQLQLAQVHTDNELDCMLHAALHIMYSQQSKAVAAYLLLLFYHLEPLSHFLPLLLVVKSSQPELFFLLGGILCRPLSCRLRRPHSLSSTCQLLLSLTAKLYSCQGADTAVRSLAIQYLTVSKQCNYCSMLQVMLCCSDKHSCISSRQT